MANDAEPFRPTEKREIGLQLAAKHIDQIRKNVTENLRYTCSAGISVNKMLAKLAAGMNKPNLQTIILPKFLEKAVQKVPIKKTNILRFDHYCPWFMNTIGLNNYKYFYCSLFWMSVTLGKFFCYDMVLGQLLSSLVCGSSNS